MKSNLLDQLLLKRKSEVQAAIGRAMKYLRENGGACAGAYIEWKILVLLILSWYFEVLSSE